LLYFHPAKVIDKQVISLLNDYSTIYQNMISMSKKIILPLVFGLIFSSQNAAIAQSKSNQEFVNDNAIKKDNFIIDASYGWPYFNALIINSTSSTQKMRNTNHIGARAEYMISDNLGVGFEFTYANASVRYKDALTGIYYERGFTKIRALPRINYHFGASKNFDPYIGGGIGYKYSVFYDQGGSINSSDEILLQFPVSVRLALGGRLYFDDVFGLNAEIGLGGPLVSAGLTIKL
jgi:outer membrane protein W